MREAWRVPVADAVEPPVATDGGRVFVATRDGSVRAINVRTGQQIWEAAGRRGVVGFGGGLLIVRGLEGRITALDPATAAVRWTAETATKGTLPPVVAGNAVLVAGEGLVALDASTGRALWGDSAARVTALPVAAGPWILSGEEDGALRCRDSATGTALWSFPTAHALLSPPAVDEKSRALLGTTDRRFVSIDLRKKGDRRWTWRLGASVQTPPAILEDAVVFATNEDVLLALDRGNGHMRWRTPLPSRPISGPILRGAAVIVACYGARPGETFLLEFDGRTGRREGDLKAPGEIQAAPLLVGDLLVVVYKGGAEERAVAALRLGALEAANP